MKWNKIWGRTSHTKHAKGSYWQANEIHTLWKLDSKAKTMWILLTLESSLSMWETNTHRRCMDFEWNISILHITCVWRKERKKNFICQLNYSQNQLFALSAILLINVIHNMIIWFKNTITNYKRWKIHPCKVSSKSCHPKNIKLDKNVLPHISIRNKQLDRFTLRMHNIKTKSHFTMEVSVASDLCTVNYTDILPSLQSYMNNKWITNV